MSLTIRNRTAAVDRRIVADDYLRLIHEFPLRPIRTTDDYEAAGKLLNRLLGRSDGKLTAGEQDYVQALALLIQDYDRKHCRFVPSNRTPQEVFQYLAKEAGLGPTALGKIMGTTHAMASLMLHGKRGISKENARTLADYFKVDVGLFV